MNLARINLLLFTLLIALAAAAWLLERKPEPDSIATLTAWQPQEIRRISIANRSGPALELVRGDVGWRMTQPYPVPANQSRIDRLLPIASAPVTASFSLPVTDLTQFGLDDPVAELGLNGMRFRVGGTDPINHHRYLATGERLLQIRDNYPHLLLAPAEQFVSPQLIDGNDRIEWIATPHWRLDRASESLQPWRLDPAPAQISSDLLVAKIADWRHAQAVRISRASVDPATQHARVQLQLSGEKTPREFLLVDTDGRRLLVDPALQLGYEIPNIGALLTPPGSPPAE